MVIIHVCIRTKKYLFIPCSVKWSRNVEFCLIIYAVEWYLEYSISRTKQSVPSLSIYTKWLLDKSNSRCLEQICWSLDSSRCRELTVLFIAAVTVAIKIICKIITITEWWPSKFYHVIYFTLWNLTCKDILEISNLFNRSVTALNSHLEMDSWL